MTSVQIASLQKDIKRNKKKLREAAKIQADIDAGIIKKADASQREKLTNAVDIQKKLEFSRKKLKQLGGQELAETGTGDDDNDVADEPEIKVPVPEPRKESNISSIVTTRAQQQKHTHGLSAPSHSLSDNPSQTSLRPPSFPSTSPSLETAINQPSAETQQLPDSAESLPEAVARLLSLGSSYKLQSLNISSRALKSSKNDRQITQVSIRFIGRIDDVGVDRVRGPGPVEEGDLEDDEYDEDDANANADADAEHERKQQQLVNTVVGGEDDDVHSVPPPARASRSSSGTGSSKQSNNNNNNNNPNSTTNARRRLELDVAGGEDRDRQSRSRTPSPSDRIRTSSGGDISISNTPRHSCRKGFQCAYRLKCKYKHTEEELSLWKNFSYLTMPCPKLANLPAGSATCGEASCTFYHSQAQARCLCCLTHLLTGHLQFLSECVGHSESNCSMKSVFAARQQPSYMSPRRQQQHQGGGAPPHPHSPFHSNANNTNNHYYHQAAGYYNKFSPRSIDRYHANNNGYNNNNNNHSHNNTNYTSDRSSAAASSSSSSSGSGERDINVNRERDRIGNNNNSSIVGRRRTDSGGSGGSGSSGGSSGGGSSFAPDKDDTGKAGSRTWVKTAKVVEP